MNVVKIPKKVQDRLVAGLKKYQPIVRKLAERDIPEAVTVTRRHGSWAFAAASASNTEIAASGQTVRGRRSPTASCREFSRK